MAQIGTQINDRGTLYTIRDIEAYETASNAMALAQENAEKIEDLTESLVFNTHNEFPNIGDSTKLYIATDENKIYRWDSTTNTYTLVSGEGSDFNIIENYL